MMMRGPILVMMLCGAGVSLAGCEEMDPYQRPYVWHPTGSNQANIAAMVQNPNDLIIGRGNGRSDAAPLMLAVDHVLMDTPKRLGAASTATAPGAGAGGN